MGVQHAALRHADGAQQQTAQAATPEVAAPVPVAGAAYAPPQRLVVGHAFDPVEADADRLADQALSRMPEIADGAVRRSTGGGGSGGIGIEGGEVDADTDRQITSRLGSGAPLPAGVRRDMETAFGKSFSGVGVHADGKAAALNRQLSATAFTVGSDIFFSGGAYRPEDPGGRRLLAHELAHVVQSGGSARRQVHRAVGFEFETNVVAHAIDDPGKGTTKPLAKMYVIKAYPEGFRMEADENSSLGSTIEFVVDPPVEEDNRAGLLKIMKKMTAVADALSTPIDGGKAAEKPSVKITDLAKTEANDANVMVGPRSTVTANPQVTGGVMLGKITKLMTEMGTGGEAAAAKAGLSAEDQTASDELDEYQSIRPKMAERAATVTLPPPLNTTKNSPELIDLGALLASYVRTGTAASVGKPPLNYAKLISGALLVRTDFGSLFKKLPQAEQTLFKEMPSIFVEWILSIAEVSRSAAGAPVFERGVYKHNAPRKGPGANVELSDQAELQVTRREWLTDITKGIDRLSSKQFPAKKATFEGLGGIGAKQDEVGAEVGKGAAKSGVVMEFRQMKKNRQINEWEALAVGVFDYLCGLNRR